MRPLIPLLFLVLSAPLAACSGEPSESPETTSSTDGGATGTTTTTTTTGTTSGTGDDPDVMVELMLSPGVNIQGKTALDQFQAVIEGDDVPIVKGPQGAWMMVGAGLTNILPENTKYANVEARLTNLAGESLAGLKQKRPSFWNGDGTSLVANLYLILHKDESWDGQEADFSMKITERCDQNPDTCVEPREVQTTVRLRMVKTVEGPGTLP
ncbi:MAG: hypothetical protein ACI9WU_004452 [Myxococcota bacterium]